MGNAIEFLNELREAGIQVRADGSRLVVAPASRLTESQIAQVRALKRELLQVIVRSTPITSAEQDGWDRILKVARRLGQEVRIDGHRYQLWGVTPRGAICWNGVNYLTFDFEKVL